MEPRPYRGRSDWKRICDLLIEGRRADNGTYYIHVGDFAWWIRSAVMRAAFNSPLPIEHHRQRYLLFMRSPVYERERDLIAIAPDGRAAACCTIWCDDVNKVGLFEPVGTHPEFQGQGIGAALMRFGQTKMRNRGVRTAMVCPNGDNPAAIKLYESVGFCQTNRLLWFSKPC
jgi:GNAT superfamily N-acetyltransferase